MSEIFCYLLILAVLVIAGMRGYKKGVVMQLPSLLPIILGILVVHLFRVSFEDILRHSLWFDKEAPTSGYVYSNLSATFLFLFSWLLLYLPAYLLSKPLRLLPAEVLGKILGGGLSILKGILWLSIFLNFWMCLNPDDKGIMHSAEAGDGNLIAAVMWFSPALFATPDTGDLHHSLQMEQAKEFERVRGIGKAEFREVCDLSDVEIVNKKNIDRNNYETI